MAGQGRHFISPEAIIATLARAIGVDPDELALQWQVEDGEFKGVILYRNLTLDEAESIIPRPTAEADDALGVPREWRDKRHD